MYFRIEKDHLGGDQYDETGKSFASRSAPAKAERTWPVVLYCYDDDGILYYTIGCSDEEAAEHAFDWSRANAGCTSCTVGKRGEKPTPFIG
jgi:hypothetical protein